MPEKNRPKISGQSLDTSKVRKHSFDRRLKPIEKKTFDKLVKALDNHYGPENVHLVVEVNPPNTSIVKTIDNEDDARSTLKKYREAE